MSKILYHYDPKTGLLVSYSEAQLDVKASTNKPVYVIPPNSTFEKPPVVNQPNRVAKFNTKTRSWTTVDDYRGMTVVNKDTKERVVWKEIGFIDNKYTFVDYDDDIKAYIIWNGSEWEISEEGRTKLLDDIWELRKDIREKECSSDLNYNGNMIHVDPVSFNDIMLAAQEAILSNDLTTTKRWVTADNVDVQLSGNDFIAIARMFGERRQRLVYDSNEAWQQDTQETNESLVGIFRELKEMRG